MRRMKFFFEEVEIGVTIPCHEIDGKGLSQKIAFHSWARWWAGFGL